MKRHIKGCLCVPLASSPNLCVTGVNVSYSPKGKVSSASGVKLEVSSADTQGSDNVVHRVPEKERILVTPKSLTFVPVE